MFFTRRSTASKKLQKEPKVYILLNGKKKQLIQNKDGPHITVASKMQTLKKMTSSLAKKVSAIGSPLHLIQSATKAVNGRSNGQTNGSSRHMQVPRMERAAPRQHIESYYDDEDNQFFSATQPDDDALEPSNYTLCIFNEALPPGLRQRLYALEGSVPRRHNIESFSEDRVAQSSSTVWPSDSVSNRNIYELSSSCQYFGQDSRGETSTFTLGIPHHQLPPHLRQSYQVPKSNTLSRGAPTVKLLLRLSEGLQVTNQYSADEQEEAEEHFRGFDGGPYCSSEIDLGEEHTSKTSQECGCIEHMRKASVLLPEEAKLWWLI